MQILKVEAVYLRNSKPNAQRAHFTASLFAALDVASATAVATRSLPWKTIERNRNDHRYLGKTPEISREFNLGSRRTLRNIKLSPAVTALSPSWVPEVHRRGRDTAATSPAVTESDR